MVSCVSKDDLLLLHSASSTVKDDRDGSDYEDSDEREVQDEDEKDFKKITQKDLFRAGGSSTGKRKGATENFSCGDKKNSRATLSPLSERHPNIMQMGLNREMKMQIERERMIFLWDARRHSRNYFGEDA